MPTYSSMPDRSVELSVIAPCLNEEANIDVLVHRTLATFDRADLDEIGLDQDLAATGIVAVEWSERLTRRMPGATVVSITDRGGDRRRIDVTRP